MTTDFRTRMFWQSLSPARRIALAARHCFYSLPWLRLADEPDNDDFIP